MVYKWSETLLIVIYFAAVASIIKVGAGNTFAIPWFIGKVAAR